jgi:hypothetical protein
MWILKNLKDMLEYIQSRSFSSCNSVNTFDFSTLYTIIPHSKDKLREVLQLCFIKKNGERRYKYIVLERDRSYFVKKNHSDSTKKFSEIDFINMLEFLINIFVIFGYKQCCSSHQLAPLFVWGRLHTGASKKTNRS